MSDIQTCLVRVDGVIERRRYTVDMEGCMPCMDIELKPGERLVHGGINDPIPVIVTDPCL